MTLALRFRGLAAAALAVAAMTSDAEAQTVIGLHAFSHHWTNEPRNNANPGLYVRMPGGFIAGAYRNSYWRPSMYAGWNFQLAETSGWSVDVSVAAATGYQRRAVTGTDAQCALMGWAPGCWLQHGYSGGKLALLVAPSVSTPLVGGWRLRVAGVPKLGVDSSAVVHLSIETVLR